MIFRCGLNPIWLSAESELSASDNTFSTRYHGNIFFSDKSGGFFIIPTPSADFH